MKKITALLVCLLSCCAALSASAQDTRRVRVSGVFDGQLLTSGDRIYARVPPEAIGVEFVFHPEPVGDVRAPSITLGVDYGQIEQTFGPDCGATPCEKRVFSVALDKQFERFEEGWGRLTVRQG